MPEEKKKTLDDLKDPKLVFSVRDALKKVPRLFSSTVLALEDSGIDVRVESGSDPEDVRQVLVDELTKLDFPGNRINDILYGKETISVGAASRKAQLREERIAVVAQARRISKDEAAAIVDGHEAEKTPKAKKPESAEG